MKNSRLLSLTLLVIILLGFNFSVKAQNTASIRIVDETNTQQTESYPIDARPLLEKFNKANGIDLTKAPAIQQQLRKTAWNFVIGSRKNWYASDYTNDQFYPVSTTCRAVGTNAYIFVEDSLWNTRVDQNAVDKVQEAFDSKTPADPNKGIFQTNVETFGNPPNVDGDPKIIILILNIKDGYTGTGGYVAGYFYGYNEYTPAQGAPYSNVAEIYYLDANPLDLKDTKGLTTGMQTAAHEFQHMIHFNYDKDELTFVNEGMSLMAEYINGYPLREQGSYNNETNFPLFEWRRDDKTKVLTDYSRAARFSLYLYEQFGKDVLKKIVQETANEANGINNALSNTTPSTLRRFKDVLEDWFVANTVNDKSFNNFYGYTESKVGYAAAREHLNPNVTNFNDSINTYGVQYISFTGGSNLSIKFDTKGISEIKIKAIKFGTTKVIEEINPAVTYNVPDFGTTYKKVTFAVFITDENVVVQQGKSKFPFSYTATGTFEYKPIELAYVKTEPIGTGGGSDKDTAVVYFRGIQETKLDSIKVALRQAGSLQGYVWKYTGTERPSPLGQRISGAFTATSSIATRPPSNPYPTPWPNWVKVDLRSLNVDASNDFAIGFINNGDYTGTNTGSNSVMLTTSPAGTHSYMYLHKPGGTSTANWYYIVDSNSDYTEFLVYAYVSFNITGVNEVVELKPASFKLEQNYPNPFNPSTVISYQLSTISNVQVKVFDMLGREVATLVNEEKPAGRYQITWNGTDNFGSKVTSGIYFYRLQAGSFVQTKKLVLMK